LYTTCDQSPTPWRKWAEVIGLALSVLAIVGFLSSALGLRLWGASQDVAALTTRVVKLEDGGREVNERIRSLENASQFQSYLVCVQLRRADPNALPPGCTPIIQSRGTP